MHFQADADMQRSPPLFFFHEYSKQYTLCWSSLLFTDHVICYPGEDYLSAHKKLPYSLFQLRTELL